MLRLQALGDDGERESLASGYGGRSTPAQWLPRGSYDRWNEAQGCGASRKSLVVEGHRLGAMRSGERACRTTWGVKSRSPPPPQTIPVDFLVMEHLDGETLAA